MPSINFEVLNPMGIVALQEKELLITSILLMLVAVIPAILMTLFVGWKYRIGNKKAKYSPDFNHSVILETTWWGIPCVIIVILAIITWKTTHQLDPYRSLDHPKKPIEIQVIALDWKWLFIYPEENIATVNFIQFPLDTPVHFSITADAPMNSFMIPQLGGQIYAMEGMTTQLSLIADKLGEFRGFSANYSGEGFSGMKFIAKASTQEEYDSWLKFVKKEKDNLSLAKYNQIIIKSKNNPVQYFSSVEQGLYDKVLAKFMTSCHGHFGHKDTTQHKHD